MLTQEVEEVEEQLRQKDEELRSMLGLAGGTTAPGGQAVIGAEVERLRVANASLEMQVEDLRQEVLTLSEELEQAEEEVAAAAAAGAASR
jgi:outer membrane protein TolC